MNCEEAREFQSRLKYSLRLTLHVPRALSYSKPSLFFQFSLSSVSSSCFVPILFYTHPAFYRSYTHSFLLPLVPERTVFIASRSGFSHFSLLSWSPLITRTPLCFSAPMNPSIAMPRSTTTALELPLLPEVLRRVYSHRVSHWTRKCNARL